MHVLINIHFLINSIPNHQNKGIDFHSNFFFQRLFHNSNSNACRKPSNENLYDNIEAFKCLDSGSSLIN